MNEKEKNIRQLLDRFMAGETSLEEENRLSEWFRTHPDVNDDLKEYQMMFGYFDEGMPLEDMAEVEDGQMAADEQKTSAKSRRLWLPISIAASIALVLGLAMSLLQQPQRQPQQLAQHQPSQELSQGEVSHPASFEVLADSVLHDKLTEYQRDSVKKKTMMPKVKRYRKHLFAPAPPATLVARVADAVTDSLVSTPEMLADAHLREMEEQQNEMFFKLYLVNVLQAQSLNADIASASYEEDEEEVHDEDYVSNGQDVY